MEARIRRLLVGDVRPDTVVVLGEEETHTPNVHITGEVPVSWATDMPSNKTLAINTSGGSRCTEIVAIGTLLSDAHRRRPRTVREGPVLASQVRHSSLLHGIRPRSTLCRTWWLSGGG